MKLASGLLKLLLLTSLLFAVTSLAQLPNGKFASTLMYLSLFGFAFRNINVLMFYVVFNFKIYICFFFLKTFLDLRLMRYKVLHRLQSSCEQKQKKVLKTIFCFCNKPLKSMQKVNKLDIYQLWTLYFQPEKLFFHREIIRILLNVKAVANSTTIVITKNAWFNCLIHFQNGYVFFKC